MRIRAHLRDVIHWAGRLCAPARSAESGRRFVRNLEAVIFGQNGGDLRPIDRCLLPTESLRASLRRGAII